MQTRYYVVAGALLLSIVLLSCGGNKEEEKKDETSVSALGAIKEMAAQAGEMSKNGPVETVDFRSLKEILPTEAGGLSRKEATGEKNGAAGFTISTATGKYANTDNTETIELSIVDAGSSAMTMGLAAWSMVDVDKETETGYEKTSQIGDYKSYEKYDNTSKSGEIVVLINKRFVVSIEGQGISMDKLKTVLDDVKLAKLAALK